MLDAATASLLTAGLAAVGFAGLVFALAYPYFAGDRAKDKRVEGIKDTRARRVSAAASLASDAAANRKRSVAESLKEIDSRKKSKEKVSLATRIERAGFDATPRDYWIASAICGVVAAAASHFGLAAPLMGTAVAAFVGTLGFPRWFLKKATARRQAKFLAELANSIDIVVRGVKSGLPLNDCLQIIARESPEPVCSEFREVVEQQRLGVSLAEGLDRMCDRMPLAEVRFLAIVIAIQQSAGGNLSEALGNLSGVLRDRVRLQMKVKALSAEAKASAMVLASLPPMVMTMVYATSPDYIMPLFNTTMGKFMLLVGACWMTMGILIMRKMINFKF